MSGGSITINGSTEEQVLTARNLLLAEFRANFLNPRTVPQVTREVDGSPYGLTFNLFPADISHGDASDLIARMSTHLRTQGVTHTDCFDSKRAGSGHDMKFARRLVL